MLDNLNKADLPIWNNKWTQIYDFTKSEGEKHFEINRSKVNDFVAPYKILKAAQEGKDIDADDALNVSPLIPLTFGD